MFEQLLWCDVLKEKAKTGESAMSLNGKEWTVTVNDEGMPCFDTFFLGLNAVRSCVTKCDTLARNGIVHEMDKLILFENPETLPPKDDIPQLPSAFQGPSPATSPTSFQRPSFQRPSTGTQPSFASPTKPTALIGQGEESRDDGDDDGGLSGGAIFAIVLVLLLLLATGIYCWRRRANAKAANNGEAPEFVNKETKSDGSVGKDTDEEII
jgi:hypothetical protein